MRNKFLDYLHREHARLEAAIADAHRYPVVDSLAIASLKKQKLLVKDQIESWTSDMRAEQTGGSPWLQQ
ncbi:YdcH family protein [Sphingomonas crocodyli]|uniref:DUF465 domain-containing protein n=1 Tax=Sphingomonas crocodyli TaxID=1979270 RepID=A0A437LYN7_9SPHN|nr:YdcH family protein [Sphingomonas crocodyli]RVT90424.1 DUF465 domain-containing protein [Sphingomonas crocodyli]